MIAGGGRRIRASRAPLSQGRSERRMIHFTSLVADVEIVRNRGRSPGTAGDSTDDDELDAMRAQNTKRAKSIKRTAGHRMRIFSISCAKLLASCTASLMRSAGVSS